jgi:hypothetical protein
MGEAAIGMYTCGTPRERLKTAAFKAIHADTRGNAAVSL